MLMAFSGLEIVVTRFTGKLLQLLDQVAWLHSMQSATYLIREYTK
jgi:hypothetical protein